MAEARCGAVVGAGDETDGDDVAEGVHGDEMVLVVVVSAAVGVGEVAQAVGRRS